MLAACVRTHVHTDQTDLLRIRRSTRITVRVRRVANAPVAQPHEMNMCNVTWPSSTFGPDVMEMRTDSPAPAPLAPGSLLGLPPRLDVQVYTDAPDPIMMVGYMVNQHTFVGTLAFHPEEAEVDGAAPNPICACAL
jgi:hypothetical protein